MSIQVGIGLSTEKNPVLAAREAARSASINLHAERANLALVFSSIDLSYPTLLKALGASLDQVPIIGCSGAAIIANQGIFPHGIAVILLSLPKNVNFNTGCVKDVTAKTAYASGKELAEQLLYGFRDVIRVFSLTLSDGLMAQGSNLIHGLQERLGTSFPLVGASASDNMRFLKTHLYFNQEILTDSAIGLLWGGRINFGLGTKHGWKPLGKPRIVTNSQDNIVYEIDGEPAVRIYEEYLARDLYGLRKELRQISVLYPIGIYLSGEEEYLLRNMLSIEDDGSVHFQGNVNTGSQIRLMIGTKESALSATQQASLDAKNALPSKPDLVLVFDSVSRYILLRRDAHKELEIIKEAMGADTPIIGFYTYGEQAPLRAISYQGQTYFHNQTITILALGG